MSSDSGLASDWLRTTTAPAVLYDQPLDEFKAEPGQSVPMGNHNIELIAAMQSFQYGEQSFALPVEATGHVGDDLRVGVEFPHLSDLPAEIPTLLGGTDSAVADDIGPGCSAQIGINVVETLSSGVPIVGDFALFGIPSQRLGVQAQHRSGFTACNVHHDRNIHHCTTMLNESLPRHQPLTVYEYTDLSEKRATDLCTHYHRQIRLYRNCFSVNTEPCG